MKLIVASGSARCRDLPHEIRDVAAPGNKDVRGLVMSHMDPRVAVAAFRSLTEARLAQATLSDRGIVASVQPRSDGYERLCVDVFDAGIDVLVDRDVATDAISIINELWPLDTAQLSDHESCNACASTDIATLPRLKLFLASATVLFLTGTALDLRDLFALVVAVVGVILLLAPNRRCRSCGERWTAPWRVAPENAREGTEVPCPACRSSQTESITRRREKALTLLVNVIMPPFFLVWPRLPRHRCTACGHEWR